MKAWRRDPAPRHGDVCRAPEVLEPPGKRRDLTGKHVFLKKKMMTGLVLLHKEDHQHQLTRLMEAFGKKAQEPGGPLRISHFHTL